MIRSPGSDVTHDVQAQTPAMEEAESGPDAGAITVCTYLPGAVLS